jgi:D-alanyl-D-alanine carboxypeptidase
MIGKAAAARRGLRWGAFVLAVAVAVSAFADAADARRKKKARPAYNPPYAAFVVDVNSGQVLHARNADALRHPASLVKIMTLYMLFEQIESGKLRLESRLPVSSYAASRPPSKLGLRAGDSIAVEDAIKALVTRSANDISVVIAEAIGGSEANFARMMTRKARSLGMTRTVYTNANGLPDRAQVTTAREQAILGRAVQERFPRLYRYFATTRFEFRGRVIGSHNRLVGRVPGVDGIKTGFIRASGFNLVSSMRRNNRHVVAVVIGGNSGRARDARMRALLEGHIQMASTRRTAPRLVEVADAGASRPAAAGMAAPAAPPPRPVAVATQTPRPVAAAPLSLQPPTPEPGSADPIKPLIVRTMEVRRGPAQGGTVTALAPAQPAQSDVGESMPPMPPAVDSRHLVAVANSTGAAAAAPTPPRTAKTAVRGGWVIQVGAFPAEEQAQDRLRAAQSVAGTILSGAEPFTETVMRGETTLFRARFAGFDRDRAQAACRYFKRNEIACLALRQQ